MPNRFCTGCRRQRRSAPTNVPSDTDNSSIRAFFFALISNFFNTKEKSKKRGWFAAEREGLLRESFQTIRLKKRTPLVGDTLPFPLMLGADARASESFATLFGGGHYWPPTEGMESAQAGLPRAGKRENSTESTGYPSPLFCTFFRCCTGR